MTTLHVYTYHTIYLAPNHYAPEKVNLDEGPSYTMGPKTALEKPNNVPAPNQYAPEKVNLDQGPAYTMRPKTAIEQPNNFPGRISPGYACIAIELSFET